MGHSWRKFGRAAVMASALIYRNRPIQECSHITLNTKARLFRVRASIYVAITSPWKQKDHGIKLLPQGSESCRAFREDNKTIPMVKVDG